MKFLVRISSHHCQNQFRQGWSCCVDDRNILWNNSNPSFANNLIYIEGTFLDPCSFPRNWYPSLEYVDKIELLEITTPFSLPNSTLDRSARQRIKDVRFDIEMKFPEFLLLEIIMIVHTQHHRNIPLLSSWKQIDMLYQQSSVSILDPWE